MIIRPRVRVVDGSGELGVLSYKLFAQREVSGRMVLDRLLAGLSAQ
jgi:putative transposase